MLQPRGSLKIKLIKQKCEIHNCNESNPKVLDFHHIIPQTELGCTDHPTNIAIICANCHRKIHLGILNIIGVIPSTELPNKRTLVYEIDGKRNIDIEIPNRQQSLMKVM
jgi:hypothetical protein